VDNLLRGAGFTKDTLYSPHPTVIDGREVPAGYCIAGAINKVLTGSHEYPRAEGSYLLPMQHMNGTMGHFAARFCDIASKEFPALWMEANIFAPSSPVSSVDAHFLVNAMVRFNNLPAVTLADMRRVLILMR
jgi:hypothetical protein